MNELAIKPKILSIAQDVLGPDGLSTILEVVKTYKVDPKEGIKAFHQFDGSFHIARKDPMLAQHAKQKVGFVDILRITPTEETWRSLERALIYCRYFINNTDLRQTSRDFIRRSCDYVENCAKYLLSTFDPDASLKYPLGRVINALKRKEFGIPEDLLDWIETFNNEIFTEAKHEHRLPPNQHLYTPDDAFLVYAIAKKLGCRMRELVKLTR